MPSVVFYFQVHQPYRVRRYSFFENQDEQNYFDTEKNAQILRKVAEKCYLPTNHLMLELIERYQGRFKIAYSISGTALEQMAEHQPEVLDSFRALAATGCVEFLAETYYHSLSAIYNEEEFAAQVRMHSAAMQQHFAQTPRVFRNTELIYSDHIGFLAGKLGYKAVIAEGADDILGWRSPNFMYSVNGNPDTRLLLKNYRLSDDIAFRFGNQGWNEFPLTADKFAAWVHNISGNGELLNLFMDYETFGEHQWASTGIFDFMRHLPERVFSKGDWDFCTPSEAIERCQPVAAMPFGRLTSWADVDRDLTAWRGNRMQDSALKKIYSFRERVLNSGNQDVIDAWRKLQTSDHFYYMCTKWFADGDVHAYFSPYESPYDAFIHYMNVLKDFAGHIARFPAVPPKSEVRPHSPIC